MEFRRGVASRRRELAALRARLEAALVDRSLLASRLDVLEKELELANRRASHEALTGLLTRTLLLDRLEHGLAHAKRYHRVVAVLMLDVNDFKQVNDRFGHSTGDAILVQIADRLRHSLRATDTACRYGGDEFVLALPDIADRGDAEVAIKQLSESLADPYRVGERLHLVTISIGTAFYPDDGTTPTEMIECADQRMYGMKAERSRVADRSLVDWLTKEATSITR